MRKSTPMMRRLVPGLLIASLVACGEKPRTTAPAPRPAPAPAAADEDAVPPPVIDEKFDESGDASYYGAEFAGRPTASGEIFDPAKHTAAHRTLPFGTELRVVNLDNGRSIKVRVNDRGPFVKNRMLDCSAACADALGYLAQGTARVGIRVVKLGDGARVRPAGAPKPPAATPPPVAPDEDDAALRPAKFAIQVGAFGSKDAAEALARKYRERGYDAYLREAGGIYRVRLGPWEEKRARAELPKVGEGLVVREDSP